jgi:hypothetical protein
MTLTPAKRPSQLAEAPTAGAMRIMSRERRRQLKSARVW